MADCFFDSSAIVKRYINETGSARPPSWMTEVDIKGVREKCNVMNDAWFEGAKSVDFNGISQADFQTEIEAAAADDAAITDLEVELKMKRDVRDDKYFALDQNRSKVGLGVAGSPDYGTTAPFTEPWALSLNPRRSPV